VKIEYSALNAIIAQNRVAYVIKKLTPYHFKDELASKVFKFMCQYFREYQKSPTPNIIQDKFKDYDYIPENGDIEYYVKQVIDNHVETKLLGVLHGSIDKMKQDGTESTMSFVMNNLLKLRSEYDQENEANLIDIVDNIKEDYTARKTLGDMSGIPTGIQSLDNLMCGFQNGELINVMAATGIGKSFLACFFALHAWVNGRKPLYISFEMSEKQIINRLLALRLHMSPSKIKHGKLSSEEENKYFRYLDALKGYNVNEGKTSFVVTCPTNPGQSSVLAAINNHRPDIVIVDYITLMIDENKDKGWEGVKNISRSLKHYARRTNVPIISLCQANSSFELDSDSPPDIDNVGYSRAIAQDSDVILSIHQNEGNRSDKIMKMKVVKMRDGEVGLNINLLWDIDRGTIKESKL